MLEGAITAVGVAGILVASAFAAVHFGKQLIRRLQVSPDVRQRITIAWSEVEKHISSDDETHWRMAIIKADAVLDMALMAKMFPGRTMHDRLKFATHKYRNLRAVRGAHGLRNDLAHDPLRELDQREARRAVNAFRSALREMGTL